MTTETSAPRHTRQSLLDRLAPLRALRSPATTDFCGQVRDVVLLASSSRGGSSMVAETLRACPSLLHLSAEVNPFLRLAGLDHPATGTDSDQLDAGHLAALDPATRALLDEELAGDVGVAADALDIDQFAVDAAWRLLVQWPELPLDPLALVEQCYEAAERIQAQRGGPPGQVCDPQASFVAVLRALAGQGLPINLWYYDLPTELLRREAPEQAAHRAPGQVLIEEPPFVVPRVRRRADPAELARRPLVIKTPSNAYRLDFLRALFPNARLRVLHLTRNPGAAINGLYDGWHHHGFHAHRMAQPLTISDYVEHCPDNRWWWKFDLPPGWREFTAAPLPRVCAFQWRSAHQAVLTGVASDATVLRLRFEDLIDGPDRRMAAFGRLCDWLDVPLDGEFRRVVRDSVDPVVATVRPRPRRWRFRSGLIEDALDAPTTQLAEQLGYADRGQWI